MRKMDMGLADRFRDALAAEAPTAPDAAAEGVVEAQQARAALLEDLHRFAAAIGHVTATLGEEGLLLEYLGRSMAFRPLGDGDRLEVLIANRPEKHRVYRERELQNRWVWSWLKLGREEKLPFFNKGLGELLVRGLGLPNVTAGDAEEPISRRTAEALVRPEGMAPAATRGEPAVEAPKSGPDERFAPDGTRRRRL